MKNNLLQRVSHEPENEGSINGMKILFYILSLAVAFMAGEYRERTKSHAPAPAPSTQETQAVAATPPPQVAVVPTPSATPAAVVATHSSTPGLISSTPTPTRIERAVAVSTTQAPVPVVVNPPAVPLKNANDVTITEPVEIPVKQDGKITGYIHLQKGQVVTPVAVEKDQIKIKSGASFVLVPIKSTDMAR